MHDIGRAFGKGYGSIRSSLTQRGEIVPPARRRSPRTLTLAEREDISRGIAAGSTIREIASGLQLPVSTVSREEARHGGRPLYRASEADSQAWESALRHKVCLLANHEELRTIVASKLILDWAPEQISKWLNVHYPSNESNACVPRNHLPQLIHPGPWSAEKRAGSALAVQAVHSSFTALPGWRKVPRSDRRCYLYWRRPAEVEGPCSSRSLGDLLAGESRNSHIATWWNVIRVSSCSSKVPSKRYNHGRRRAGKASMCLNSPPILRRSLTWDRGPWIDKYKSFTVDTNVKVYFCDVHRVNGSAAPMKIPTAC